MVDSPAGLVPEEHEALAGRHHQPPTPSTPPKPKPLSSPATFSPELRIDDHDSLEAGARPAMVSHMSEPPGPTTSYASPLRHHKRAPSKHREVKETLDARVEFLSDEVDGRTHHRINQFVIQDEIGRGSYGAVHIGTDQFGTEYAVKEFSKVRLRKRAQSNILRQGPHRPPRRAGLDAPLTPFAGGARAGEKDDALYLIREEVAIMKKLNHPNLVQLIEVLDDPEEDSLYMVMEMCKKGVVMKVGLEETTKPYEEERCRHLFRDLILGIEYLHAHGVIHRDIKPDNLLLSEDDVLKVVDFGVSQMFERPDQMRTAKSAGSPAFLPPELCGKHGDVSGKAADIWSMGVSLYCLRYGGIPFNREGMMEMYDAIKTEEPSIPEDETASLGDLFRRILEKDPEKRIKMPELREHPWVTKNGQDPLLSKEENCAKPIDPPNELEVNHAFTRKMNHLLCVMKVLQKFKQLKVKKAARLLEERGIKSGLGSGSGSSSNTSVDGLSVEKARAEEIEALLAQRRRMLGRGSSDDDDGNYERGSIRDVADHEPLLLGIGTGGRDEFRPDEVVPNVVADSPTAVDFNVYDKAYLEAVEERLRSNPRSRPTMYLTRFVKERDKLQKVGADVVELSGPQVELALPGGSSKLADLVAKVDVADSKEKGEVVLQS